MSPFTEKLGESFAGVRYGREMDTSELRLFLPCGMPTDISQDSIANAIVYTITDGLDGDRGQRLVLAREPSVVWQIAMPERRMYDHTREVWIEQKSQRSGYKIAIEFALEPEIPAEPELISPEAIEEAKILAKASKGRAK